MGQVAVAGLVLHGVHGVRGGAVDSHVLRVCRRRLSVHPSGTFFQSEEDSAGGNQRGGGDPSFFFGIPERARHGDVDIVRRFAAVHHAFSGRRVLQIFQPEEK